MRDATQLRCVRCQRRLADYLDNVQRGHALFEILCPKCGSGNTLSLRPQSPAEGPHLERPERPPVKEPAHEP